jgi:20S proteasome alpha/beta subunit
MEEGHLRLTLLVALKGIDGLVLAADSRGTFGDPRGITAQNDSQQKAHTLAPHAAVLASGAGEIGTLIITQTLQAIQSQQVDGVTNVMNVLRATARTLYQEWFPTLPPVSGPMQQAGQMPGRPDIGFVVAGYDRGPSNNFDVPQIYQLVSGLDFPPMLHAYGFAVSGMVQYALYLLNRLYEKDRGFQELTPLAVYAITETASQDGKVGGPVRVITITPGGCVELIDSAVEEIISSNAARAATLRNSFYERGNA